jgi:nuclear receptor interaction protein
MSKLHSLSVHRGCVNTIWWDETGQYLLSGSDDHRLIITEPYSKKIYVDVHTSHRANVFSAKFLPASNIRKIVSCAGDGNILFTGQLLYLLFII